MDKEEEMIDRPKGMSAWSYQQRKKERQKEEHEKKKDDQQNLEKLFSAPSAEDSENLAIKMDKIRESFEQSYK